MFDILSEEEVREQFAPVPEGRLEDAARRSSCEVLALTCVSSGPS